MTDTLHQQIEQDVRATVQSGADIYQRVRTITLKALTERELDIDNIKNVLEAVLNGVSSGLNEQYEPAKEAIKQSAEALDDALQKTAQASRLALEEAASHAADFSQHDLRQSAEDVQALESLFLDTLEKVARNSSETVSNIFVDFISHARQSGTAVGKEAQIALNALDNLRHKSQDAVLSGAAATAATLASISSGILSGIAESLHPEKTHK